MYRSQVRGVVLGVSLLTLLALAAGCGGGGGSTSPPTPSTQTVLSSVSSASASASTLVDASFPAPAGSPPDPAPVINPAALIAAPGGSVSLDVDTQQPVDDILITADGDSGYYDLNVSGSRQASGPQHYSLKLVVTAALNAYILHISTRRGANISQAANVTLKVAVPTGSITVAASPATHTVSAGQSTSYSVSVQAMGGFSSPVNLSVSGLPSGATATFAPAAVTPTAAGVSSTLTVATLGATPAGTSSLTVTASGGGVNQQATVSLVVLSDVGPPPPPSFRYAGPIASDAE